MQVLLEIEFLCIFFLSQSPASYFLVLIPSILCTLPSTPFPLLFHTSSLLPTPLTPLSLLCSSVQSNIFFFLLFNLLPSLPSLLFLSFLSSIPPSYQSSSPPLLFPLSYHTTSTHTGHQKTEKRTTNDSSERIS